MSLIIKKPWTRQPQYPLGINWANPITQALQVCILPQYGDMVSGLGPPTIRGAGSYTPGVGGIAAKQTFTGGGANDFIYPVRINAAGDRTFAIFGSNVASGGLISAYVSDADSSDSLVLNTTAFYAVMDNKGGGR